jgi:urea transport system permease protein
LLYRLPRDADGFSYAWRGAAHAVFDPARPDSLLTAAACLGVATRRVDATTFAIGSGLAGVAGCALSLLGPVGPSLGTYYIVDAFMVVVLGGVGMLPGTIMAALAIGGLNTAYEYGSTASLGKAIVFGLVVLFLQWRPAGLVALRTR